MLDKLFNPARTVYKWDRFWVGFVPGLFGPLVGVVLFYFIKFSGHPFADYIALVKRPQVLSPILSFGVIINLFIFFPFIWSDRYNAARGVIGATMLYIIPILVAKFLM